MSGETFPCEAYDMFIFLILEVTIFQAICYLNKIISNYFASFLIRYVHAKFEFYVLCTRTSMNLQKI